MNTPVDGFQKNHVSYSTVEEKNLPFHCPPKDAQKWSMHPKVFIQFDKNGKGVCPYCGASYQLA